METNEVTIFLIPTEAVKFRVFQEKYEVFNTLLDNGVFEVRNGSVALHFDNDGTLQLIQRADVLYRKLSTGGTGH